MVVKPVQSDTLSTSDVTPIPDLLTVQAQRDDTLPEKFVFDQIAGRGKTAHDVAVASNGHTQLVAYPMPPKKSRTFSAEDFALSQNGLWLTCPHDRTTNHCYRSGSGDGWTFRFLPAQCADCPLRKACRDSTKTPTPHRDVFVSDYRADYDRLVAYSQTDDFKLDMKLRPQIERIVAGLVLHNGAHHARFCGQMKVDFQMKPALSLPKGCVRRFTTPNTAWCGWIKYRVEGDDPNGVVGSCPLPPRHNCARWPAKTGVFDWIWPVFAKKLTYVELNGKKTTVATAATAQS